MEVGDYIYVEGKGNGIVLTVNGVTEFTDTGKKIDHIRTVEWISDTGRTLVSDSNLVKRAR